MINNYNEYAFHFLPQINVLYLYFCVLKNEIMLVSPIFSDPAKRASHA